MKDRQETVFSVMDATILKCGFHIYLMLIGMALKLYIFYIIYMLTRTENKSIEMLELL